MVPLVRICTGALTYEFPEGSGPLDLPLATA